MSKVVRVEYDAEHETLVLPGPLHDVKHREALVVTIERPATDAPQWLDLSGSLSKEAGESFAAALDELYPPSKK